MQKGLHFVTGEKGGIGKSLFTMVLLEYFNNLGFEYKFYDADRSSPDVGLIYGESYEQIVESLGQQSQSSVANFSTAIDKNKSDFISNEQQPLVIEQIYFSEDEEDSFRADRFYVEACEDNLVIVNLPAQVELLINRWLVERNILDNLEDGGCDIYYWFVTDGSVESLDLLQRSLKQYGNKIKHIVVRNKGLNKSVDQNIFAHSVIEIIRSLNIKTVEMPSLVVSNTEMQIIKTSKIKLGEVTSRENNIKGINFLTKQRIKSFLKYCQHEITTTTVFSQESEKKFSNENEVVHEN